MDLALRGGHTWCTASHHANTTPTECDGGCGRLIFEDYVCFDSPSCDEPGPVVRKAPENFQKDPPRKLPAQLGGLLGADDYFLARDCAEEYGERPLPQVCGSDRLRRRPPSELGVSAAPLELLEFRPFGYEQCASEAFLRKLKEETASRAEAASYVSYVSDWFFGPSGVGASRMLKDPR